MNSLSESRRSRVVRAADSTDIMSAQLDERTLPSSNLGGLQIDQRIVDGVMAQARSNGYATGLEEGLAAADAQVQRAEQDRWDHIRSAAAALNRSAEQFETAQAAAFRDIEDALATAAFLLTEALLGRELATASTPGRDAVARAMRLAPERLPANVYLNPNDADAIGDISQLAPGRSLEIIKDPTIAPGDCRVAVARTVIDATLHNAVERAREALEL